MRHTALSTVNELAKKNKKIIFIGSDLGFNILDDMKKELPNQFLMEGICEQNIIGMSAGLAMQGYIPFVNTIGTFLTRRCLEQIIIDLCFHNLPVRLLGNGGGGVYASLGPTHISLDDFSILRSIPNMTILSPCDKLEMKKLLIESVKYKGPIYVRFGLGGEKVITKKNYNVKIGKAMEILPKNNFNIITTGSITQTALEVAKLIKENFFIDIGILHIGTIKPLDKKKIINFITGSKKTIVVEEHFRSGGLGSSILELCNNCGADANILKLIGIPDKFPDQNPNHDAIKEYWGLDKKNLYYKVLKVYGIRK
jgi:transketolase